MTYYIKCVTRLNEVTGKTLSYLIVPLMFIVLAELISRSFFDRPTNWIHEMSGFLLAYYSVLTGGYVLMNHEHVNVEILYNFFPPLVKRIARILSLLLFFYLMIVIIWHSGKLAIEAIQLGEHSSTMWGPILWPVRIVIPIAAVLLLLQGIAHFLSDLYFLITRRDLK